MLQVTWCTRKIRTRPAHRERGQAAGHERAAAQREAQPGTGSARLPSAISGKAAVDASHDRVLEEVAGEPFRGRLAVRLEQPADVRVPQARAACRADRRRGPACGLCGSPSSSVNAWCLRWSATQSITRTLQRHRPEDRERVAQPRVRLERPVGEQPVEADRDAERGEQVHDREDRQIARHRGSWCHSSTAAAITPRNGITTAAMLTLRSRRVTIDHYSRWRPRLRTGMGALWGR